MSNILILLEPTKDKIYLHLHVYIFIYRQGVYDSGIVTFVPYNFIMF